MSAQKYSLLILMQCVIVVGLQAQQTPQISHYMFNSQMYNPASMGFTNSIVASGIHRQQWYGMEDKSGMGEANSPQTTLVSIDAPLRFIQSGVGLNFINDKIGALHNTTIQLAYNYQLPVRSGILGIGIQGGMTNMRVGFTNMIPTEGVTSIGADDVLRGKGEESDWLFDVSAGLYYRVPDQYEIGISMAPINQPSSSYSGYKQKRNLHLSGNYHFSSDMFPKIDFVPSALIKSEFSSMQVDVSMIGIYDKQYWGGLTYRMGDAVVLMGGLIVQYIQMGLAYELATNRMFKSSKIGGSFEVFARYSFNLSVDRLPQSYKNSRFL